MNNITLVPRVPTCFGPQGLLVISNIHFGLLGGPCGSACFEDGFAKVSAFDYIFLTFRARGAFPKRGAFGHPGDIVGIPRILGTPEKDKTGLFCEKGHVME